LTATDVSLSFVALLDVLGYKNHLEEDQSNGTYAFKDTLERAFHNCPSVNEAEYPFFAISDTIIITSINRKNFKTYLEILKEIQLAFLKEGIFIRGGVSYGHHFKSGNLTYSPTIARANDIEKNAAQNPRIVIDYNIIDLLQSLTQLEDICASGLLCESNDVYFLNVFTPNNWKSIYDYAKKMFEREREIVKDSMRVGKRDILFRNQSIFSKHIWFENYLFSSPYCDPSLDRYIPKINFFT
jgi:hypothetical protein